jgi:hypothetical protein
LGDTNSSIHQNSPLLVDSMSVDVSGFVVQLVVDIDDQFISNIGPQRWTRPLPIDADHWPNLSSVRIGAYPRDIQVVCDCLGKNGLQAEQKSHKETRRSHGGWRVKGTAEVEKTEKAMLWAKVPKEEHCSYTLGVVGQRSGETEQATNSTEQATNSTAMPV